MKPETIMVVEDNPLASKMVRVTLGAEGYHVLEAPDGRTALDLAAREMPDLVLLDLRLPDMTGFDVVGRLRSLPGGKAIPILAFSGILSHLEETQLVNAGFTDFAQKPVEPSRLLRMMQVYLPLSDKAQVSSDRGKQVLLADDDPIQMKLTVRRLDQAGFRVTTAADGAEALEKARRHPPDAIVSDVLMPNLDGFQLCAKVRRDPQLAGIPVILTSSHFVEERDRRMAEKCGANTMVLRTPDMEDIISSLRAGLSEGAPSVQAGDPTELDKEYKDRILHQLERQVVRNHSLSERSALQAAALSVLSRLSTAVARTENLNMALNEILAQCLDAAGISTGAIYLQGQDGSLSLIAQTGYVGPSVGDLGVFFDHMELLDQAVASKSPLKIPSPDIPEATTKNLLLRSVGTTALIIPLMLAGECYGVLFMVSNLKDLTEEHWVAFAGMVGSHFAEGLALTRSVSRLRESELQKIAILDSALDCVVAIDEEGRIVEFNPSAERTFGYSREAVLGREMAELIIPPSLRERHHAGLRHYLATGEGPMLGKRIEMSALRSDGTEFPVEFSINVVYIGGKPIFTAYLRDISERKQTQETLQKTHDRLTALFQASPMGITVLDPDGRVQLWNPAAERIFGWREEEVLGRPLPTVPPDRLEEFQSHRRQILDGRAFMGKEVVRQRKDGSLIDISLSTGELKDTEGRRVGILGIMLDITERKQMERQAVRLEQLATLGQLLSGIAHELKNPLFILSGRLQLVSEKLDVREYDTVGADFQKIEDAARRMTDITQRFLTFARPHTAQKTRCDVNSTLEQIMEFLSNELMKNRIRIVTSLNQNLPPVWCDPRELQQIFTNLILNAVYVMAKANGRGTLTISTATSDTAVEIRVRDDGPGIMLEHRAKLFDPFFTTKPVGEGTGLGLWIVKSLITGMRGTIECEAEVGHGATFIIRLPPLPADGSA